MIRNFLFSFFFFLGIFLISILFIPSLFLPQKIVLFGGKIMGYWASICLRIFLSTTISALSLTSLLLTIPGCALDLCSS